MVKAASRTLQHYQYAHTVARLAPIIRTQPFSITDLSTLKLKVKSCYNPLRLGTVNVLVSSHIDFVNTPRLYSD